jgi:hypothetical protein
LVIVKAEEKRSSFESIIPFESYTNDGYWITTKYFSKKQKRLYRKERKEYLKNLNSQSYN